MATFQSATQAFSALSGIPIVGPALGAVAAALAVASGIANVKKILAVKSGLPGDGGGSSSISAAAPANVPPPASVRTNVNPEIGAGIVSRGTEGTTENGIELQPTLVEDDVTQKQKSATNIKNTALL